MIALILAAAISSAPAAHVEDAVMVAMYSAVGAMAERAYVASWLDEQDVVRAGAIERLAAVGRQLDSLDAPTLKASPFESDAKASPFADDAKPDPFDGEPKLFWWSTAETKTERW
jgi:hypothetical protein